MSTSKEDSASDKPLESGDEDNTGEITLVMGAGAKVQVDSGEAAKAESLSETFFIDASGYSPEELKDHSGLNSSTDEASDKVKEDESFIVLGEDAKKILEEGDSLRILTDSSDSEEEDLEWKAVAVDPVKDSILPGLYRTVLAPTEDSNEIDDRYSGIYFPKKGALVEVLVEGRMGTEIVYPKRNLKYFLGDGHLEGLPFILDVALTYVRRGEKSLITITDVNLLNKPKEWKLQESTTDNDDPSEHHYYEVTLEKFQNLPDVPEEYAIEDRLVLCEQLNSAANKLQNVNELTRAITKYDFVRNNLDDFAILVKEIPEEFDAKRNTLLEKALIGIGTCLLELEEPQICQPKMDVPELSLGNDPSNYANRALIFNPNSFEALLLLAEIYFLRKEPQKALDLYYKVHELQPTPLNIQGVRFQMAECMKMLKEEKIAENQMSTRMLGLKM